MPKNKGKGGKRKRRGKKNVQQSNIKSLRVSENEHEKYGKVTALLGNCRIMVETPTKETYMLHIPGSFKKRVWINMDDIVLFQVRSFEPDKGDVISKYFPNEVKWLTKRKYIPGHFSGLQVNDGEANDGIEWKIPNDDDDSGIDSDATPSEKERMKKEKEARDAVPNQQRIYDLPPSDSEDDAEEDDIQKILMDL